MEASLCLELETKILLVRPTSPSPSLQQVWGPECGPSEGDSSLLSLDKLTKPDQKEPSSDIKATSLKKRQVLNVIPSHTELNI